MGGQATGPDRKAVARAFRKVAAGYAAADFMHAEIRARLLERLDLVSLQPATILDLGAGPPEATAALAARYPQAHLLAIDLVPAMPGAAAQPWDRICADAAALPFASQSVDLVVAGMLLHWCEDPDAVLAEVRRVLRVPGLLLLTTLGPQTLRELRSAWGQVDQQTHTLSFTDMHNLGDALIRAGFAEPVVDAENLTVTYRDAGRLVADLRGVGASDLGPRRRRSLTAPGRWRAMLQALEAGRSHDGNLHATLEVLYGQAWTGDRGATRGERGEVEISLERLRRRPP
ncbi:malonyl-CoA O-methyltransferase [Gammaproteobacteria bacterium]|nr:methyltransferase domain-containing protein [Gammaproteobacteria bacterium]CAG0944263.1 malonyl-CoA O-methyltransferase [Gammaproteobacteria bacterium]